MDALIGATGFVGGHLARQHDFAAAFNSKTIAQAHGLGFDRVVCAGAPGSMFLANRDPAGDAEAIDRLITSLAQIKAKRFVLISTIAVLADPAAGHDESADQFETDKAYGRNRRRLEAWCLDRFPRCSVIRLPALFGAGLRKNFVFDLLNPAPAMLTPEAFAEVHAALPEALKAVLAEVYRLEPERGLHVLDRGALARSGVAQALGDALMARGLDARRFTHPDSSFQYYDMGRLWADIGLFLGRDAPIVHFAPPPLSAADVHELFLGAPFPDMPKPPVPHREDMHTRFFEAFDAPAPYAQSQSQVRAALMRFFEAEQAKAGAETDGAS